MNVSYVTSKFAVRAITQTAALEWGEHNITVNAYAPGFIDTPMGESALWFLDMESNFECCTVTVATKGQPGIVEAVIHFHTANHISHSLILVVSDDARSVLQEDGYD
jgi:NAD(P)-dependent dehydrogenase (short-subunit alcohol dehydrogenase family)